VGRYRPTALHARLGPMSEVAWPARDLGAASAHSSRDHRALGSLGGVDSGGGLKA
jgi:hypothetical protein